MRFITWPFEGGQEGAKETKTFVWNKNMMGVDNDRHGKIINIGHKQTTTHVYKSDDVWQDDVVMLYMAVLYTKYSSGVKDVRHRA